MCCALRGMWPVRMHDRYVWVGCVRVGVCLCGLSSLCDCVYLTHRLWVYPGFYLKPHETNP
jgi:hypothetical protein